MKRQRSVPFALFATLALAWSLPALGYGDCNNGKLLFNKTTPTVPTACANSSCHKASVSANNIQNAAMNPGLIDQALDGPPGDQSMVSLNLRANLPLSPSDIDDLANWIFYAPTCPSGGAPNLQAAPSPVSFASTNVGATSPSTTVTITNAGTAAALAVTATSGDATHFPLSSNTCTGVTVNAGATCSFKVAFHPTAAGPISANVTVNRTGGTLTVGVSGTGTATVTPGQLSMTSSISFGSLTVGTTSAPNSVTISNTGGTAVAVSSVASSNPSEFAVASNTCATVNAGSSCSVGVTFRPSAAGSRNATITVTSNGLGSPQTISASGTGAATATPGQLSMSASINFGNQTTGVTSAPSNVTLTNVGGTAVAVSSVTSSNPGEFAIVSNSCATVNAGGNCSLGLTFKPAADGARSGSLSIVSNGTGSPQAIALSGAGNAQQQAGPSTVTVVEYHNSTYDSYFITPVAAEIALLDAHQAPFQAWSRTGLSFNAYVNASAPAGSAGICRFINVKYSPNLSHFYAPHGLGCEATISGYPEWQLEDDKLFNSMLPDAGGTCPVGTVPVYRLFNNYTGGAPNHRFVTSLTDRQAMLNKGYVAEGAGIGVGMCVPPISTKSDGTGGASPGLLSMSLSINFGGQSVGTASAMYNETVTNIGGTAVTVTGVASSNPAEFAVASNTCTSVAPGATCTIGVTFTPSAPSARSATITVSNSGSGSPATVAASGIGFTGSSPPTVTVVEYHNSTYDSYFITPVAAEIALLDAHAPPFQAWARTGLSFNGYVNTTAPIGSVGICRFNNSNYSPNISHFYAPHGLGCEATIASLPDWKLEDDKLFNAVLPDSAGACPAGTVPVYRLFNNNIGGAPNHRFVTSLNDRQTMLNKGYIAEGNGIGVGMCAPI